MSNKNANKSTEPILEIWKKSKCTLSFKRFLIGIVNFLSLIRQRGKDITLNLENCNTAFANSRIVCLTEKIHVFICKESVVEQPWTKIVAHQSRILSQDKLNNSDFYGLQH